MACNQIPYGRIIAAKSGDPEAMTMILRHYAPYIAFCAKRSFYDDYGNRYEIVDEDIRQRIEAKLMIQIFYKFDPYRLPSNE